MAPKNKNTQQKEDKQKRHNDKLEVINSNKPLLKEATNLAMFITSIFDNDDIKNILLAKGVQFKILKDHVTNIFKTLIWQLEKNHDVAKQISQALQNFINSIKKFSNDNYFKTSLHCSEVDEFITRVSNLRSNGGSFETKQKTFTKIINDIKKEITSPDLTNEISNNLDSILQNSIILHNNSKNNHLKGNLQSNKKKLEEKGNLTAKESVELQEINKELKNISENKEVNVNYNSQTKLLDSTELELQKILSTRKKKVLKESKDLINNLIFIENISTNSRKIAEKFTSTCKLQPIGNSKEMRNGTLLFVPTYKTLTYDDQQEERRKAVDNLNSKAKFLSEFIDKTLNPLIQEIEHFIQPLQCMIFHQAVIENYAPKIQESIDKETLQSLESSHNSYEKAIQKIEKHISALSHGIKTKFEVLKPDLKENMRLTTLFFSVIEKIKSDIADFDLLSKIEGKTQDEIKGFALLIMDRSTKNGNSLVKLYEEIIKSKKKTTESDSDLTQENPEIDSNVIQEDEHINTEEIKKDFDRISSLFTKDTKFNKENEKKPKISPKTVERHAELLSKTEDNLKQLKKPKESSPDTNVSETQIHDDSAISSIKR